jgi:antitoxin component YwqK of YwqJK toxin-antitoxin module
MKSFFCLLLSIIFISGIQSQNRYSESQLDWDIEDGGKVYFYKNTKQRFSGIVFQTYENGQISFEEQVHNGKGVSYKSWYKNGKLEHDENENLGIKKDFYENGKLKSITHEHFTKNIGNEKEFEYIYDENGFTIHKEFYENGQLKSEYESGSTVNSFFIGTHNEYFDNGMIKERCYFKNGQFDGKYFCWYSNGKLKYDGSWSQGKVMIEKCWDENGNPIKCTGNFTPRFNK